MHPTRPAFISALISFIIAFIHFASAESAPSSYLDDKNVTATHTLGHGEVATQPGHILPEKNKISRGLTFPSDHEFLQSVISFANLMNCRFSNNPVDCFEDYSTDVRLQEFASLFGNVLVCRLAPEGDLCAEQNGDAGLAGAIAAISSYAAVPSPTFKIATATVIGTEMVTTTGTVTNTGMILATIFTSTDLRGVLVTSSSLFSTTQTSTGTLTTPSMFTSTEAGQPTEVPTLAKVNPTKRSTPMMKRADDLQLDANTTRKELDDTAVQGLLVGFELLIGLLRVERQPTNETMPSKRWTSMMKRADEIQLDVDKIRKELSDEDTGEIITIVLGSILDILKKVTPTTNASMTALAGTTSSSDTPIPSATSVPLTKRSIPAAITQDPHTSSATAAPTSSANISLDGFRAIPTAVVFDPILDDDLLSGGLVPEEPRAVDGAVDGQLEETATLVPGNGQAGVEGKVGRRRVRYNGAELARMMN